MFNKIKCALFGHHYVCTTKNRTKVGYGNIYYKCSKCGDKSRVQVPLE